MPRKTGQDIFIDGRVSVNPVPVTNGKKATIKYSGLLSQSGADGIYMHYGYGSDWSNSGYTMMMREADTLWSCSITVNGTDRLNFCFKDSANNWDNNHGMNWGCEIS